MCSAARACSPSPTATTLRVRDGERMLTDGPYAETKEQLGGYYLLECKDLDEALDWAARIPEAKTGRGRGPAGHGLRRAAGAGSRRGDRRVLTRVPRTFSSTACSGASRDRRSPSSPASSATSTAPRRRCRTRSSPRSSAGRATGCPTTRRPGSSPRRATARSTGSAPRSAGPGGASRSRPSCGRSAAARTRARRPELVSPIPDERLRLIFTTCHPALAPEARVGLTLRALGGLTTAEVARAFLISERAMAQRIIARQGEDRQRRHPLRGPARRRPARAPAQRARHGLPDLQRRLRAAGARGAVRGGDPARARARRADARRGRGDRAARADAAAGLAPRRARGRRRPARPARPTRTARAGTSRRSPRASGWSRAAGGSGRLGLLPRPGLDRRPSTRAARTGRGSSGSTTSSTRSRRREIVALNRAVAIAERDGPEAGLAADGRPRPGRLPPLPRRPRRPPAPAGPAAPRPPTPTARRSR